MLQYCRSYVHAPGFNRAVALNPTWSRFKGEPAVAGKSEVRPRPLPSEAAALGPGWRVGAKTPIRAIPAFATKFVEETLAAPEQQ